MIKAQARVAPAARPQRCSSVACQAVHGSRNLAAALAAAVLLSSAPLPAHAGVVMVQPILKKAFQSDDAGETVKRQERAFKQAGAPGVAAPKPEESSMSGGAIDFRVLALPGAIGGIAGLAFLASKIDGEFSEWINSGPLVRNSDNWAGFEETIKNSAYDKKLGYEDQPSPVQSKVTTKSGTKFGTKSGKAGTKAIAKTGSGTKKTIGGFTLPF
eukprot:CAMPEP_0119106248 /NCGR_PEP_ID=MMETSP1180-20130426/3987_1 /TAXON_ID=3052 ORGANISM="Chlamydomonas cf sp, Strain CCMP681" /NCGR_SAMPLE_ID=MMETSP1180 /ASSEMBLY_ACC=CAM_ASM_000741 /LENGTH=213 /DNA_ID=CAMNT_0007091535 /DNA_START=41 /DNA_END=682 /DNA_ORIENTATION=+